MAVAAVAVTPLAACSGGVSKEDFIAAADDVCREADERIRAVGAPRLGKGILDYVDRAREISDDLVADLRELDPPAADRDGLDRMLDGLERATDLLGPLARATTDRAAGKLQDLQEEVTQVTGEVSAFAESYGFEVCGAEVFDTER